MKQVTIPKQFQTEEKCIAFLETLRWPDGVRCPKCAHDRISRFQTTGKTGKSRQLYQCLECRYQFSARTGTIFHDSHLPLQKWFTAMALIGESGGTISANQLRQALGVQYKTAWQLGNRLRHAMQQSVQETIQEKVDAGQSPGGGESNPAAWEREVFLRFLEGNGREESGPAAAASQPAQAGRPAATGSGSARAEQKPSIAASAPADNGPRGLSGPVEELWNFWKRGVFDSLPVVGARHIPGYMNEMTFLFGKLFFSTMRDAFLVMPRLAGIEAERWTSSGQDKGK